MALFDRIIGISDKEVAEPQSIQSQVVYPGNIPNSKVGNPGEACVLIQYCGLLTVEHFTGDDLKPLSMLFALCAMVPAGSSGAYNSGRGGNAILPVHAMHFRGATLSASIANYVDKTDVCVASVLTPMRADLWTAELTTGQKVNIVMGQIVVQGQNSEIHTIAYQANVLVSLIDPPPPPIFYGPAPLWDGRIKSVGSALHNGVAQGQL